MKNEWRVLAAVCVLVVGVYAYATYSGFMATPDQQAADAYYNQLVEGFQAGQLNLKVDVPAGLTQLANPYDPTANAPYLAACRTLVARLFCDDDGLHLKSERAQAYREHACTICQR
jgi:hypothetical protein